MDILSELTQISANDRIVLAVLALLDATSGGTLALPVVLLLLTGGPGKPGGPDGSTGSSGRSARATGLRVLAYLAIIAAFYWLLGLALLAGLQAAIAPLAELIDQRVGAALAVGLGAVLAWLSWWLDPSQIRRRGGDPQASMGRWIGRADRVAGSWRGVAALALAAGLAEAATMVPYLVAIAGMGRYDLSPVPAGSLLALYCLLMILPALVLVIARMALGERLRGPLGRVRELVVRTAPETAAWGFGIVGVVLILRGVGQLW